jgi:hypothetical protein
MYVKSCAVLYFSIIKFIYFKKLPPPPSKKSFVLILCMPYERPYILQAYGLDNFT